MEAAARAAKDSGRAVPLITQDDSTGKYVVSEEALELLAGIEAPLAVVAIAGLWRTGKSYLLNQFSGAVAEKKGFAVGATVNACTKGLWLWGQPVKLEDGLSVLFVDTEGLGSTSRTQTEDSQIFSLALLLSSLFVWNSRGVIDGNALEDFALVVNLTKHIHVRSDAANKALTTGEAAKKDGGAPAKKAFVAGAGGPAYAAGGHELDSLAEHFPSFMWVVRDFTLRLEDGGRKINDRQYLENALKPQTSFSSEAASRNQIRTLLSSFFRERDCVTLVRPAEDEAVLRDLSNRELHELRPEFQAGLAKLKGKVFASVRAKAVKGRALSGKMLGTLAQT
ncbi:P-loop containing nucleoside triphosphate hydrolase protein [Pelagophyceae sp. CCMP2097]|nr:P-loop containing nucleoside triphosphate hydrolase protein [Pelagophyceae sp. CCMP2097]